MDMDMDISSLAGLRVLIVDDEADVRQLFTEILTQYGVIVTAVASAKIAFTTLSLNSADYDVLLSDISMPGEDGYSLIRRIRGLSATGGGLIPAAALTALAGNFDRQEALAAGFQLHLAKPISPHHLVLVVAKLAGQIKNN